MHMLLQLGGSQSLSRAASKETTTSEVDLFTLSHLLNTSLFTPKLVKQQQADDGKGSTNGTTLQHRAATARWCPWPVWSFQAGTRAARPPFKTTSTPELE